LYDTHNWKAELRDEGRRKCARFASATHVKTFKWDAAGNEVSGERPEEAIKLLLDSGYKGVWGIESVPEDADEYAGRGERSISFENTLVERRDAKMPRWEETRFLF
jgi:hypothetical protein